MANAQQSDDPWGDEEDDALFLEASQMLEQEEERKWREHLAQLKAQEAKTLASTSTSTALLSPTQATAAFNIRRAQLQETDNSNQSHFVLEDENHLSLKQMNTQFQAEKQKNAEISSRLQAVQGETDNLRRQLEKLKKSQQADLYTNIKKERELKEKNEEERRALVKEKNALMTDLRLANDEIKKLKQKVAASGNSSRLSIGGASPVRPQSVPFPRPPYNSKSQTFGVPSPRFKSEPSLNSTVVNRQPLQQQPIPLSPVSPVVPVAKVQTDDKHVEADESLKKLEEQDNLMFSSVKENNVINIHHLDSIASIQLKSARQRIFTALRSLIGMDFIEVKPILEKVAKAAPTEIMARFAAGNEFKVCFPGLTDSMYLCGVQAQRKRENEASGEHVEVTYPIIPTIKNPNPKIIDLNGLQDRIAIQLKNGGVWAALREIKRDLKALLQEFSGEQRFKLYEIGNLSILWHLLGWARHLWNMILMEEELEFVVESFGKAVWLSELKEWSGLVLKIDWRDYYVPELESVIRRLSLSILESVVTLGYFEESQKRYEILYCILKDTLLKPHLRNEATIRQCLVIATWTIADKNILNYLCLEKKNKNCLAFLLGEAVLQFFKETKNQHASVNVLAHYLNLLENLMVKQPHYLYTSKICRPIVNAARQKSAKRLLEHLTENEVCHIISDSEEEDENSEVPEPENVLAEDEAMDVDPMMLTQFADPDKYKFEDGCQERARKFNNVKNVKCWINPAEWEVPIVCIGEKPCQCRKSLLGSAFIMLNATTKFWIQAYLDHEKAIEESQEREEMEMRVRMETLMADDEILKKLQKKSDTWRQFILEFLSETREKALTEGDGQDDTVAEWTWDELLKYQQQQQTRNTETEETADWMWQRRRTENIFDYVIREGAKLMEFCNEKADNLALAVGSEGFSCHVFLEKFFKFYAQNLHMTMAESGIVLETTKGDEEGQGGLPEENIFDIDEEDEFLDQNYEENMVFDPAKILAGLPSWELPRLSEKEYEESLRLVIEKMGDN